MTCAQLQLNLRTVVQRVPECATTCLRQPSVFDGVDGRLNFPYRPGAGTLILDSTANGLEHKHGNSSVENEVGQGERHSSSTIELTTSAMYTPQSTTGPELNIVSSVDLESGERASSPISLGGKILCSVPLDILVSISSSFRTAPQTKLLPLRRVALIQNRLVVAY